MLLLRDLPKYECIKAKAERFPEVDPSAVQSCLLLLRVASDVLAQLEAHFAAHGLSQGRFTVMMLLSRADESFSASDLAERAGVTRATMTGLLDGLQRDGFVERQPSARDRRKVTVRLTERGRTHLESMLPSYFSLVARLMGPLSETDRDELMELLSRLRQMITWDERAAANAELGEAVGL